MKSKNITSIVMLASFSLLAGTVLSGCGKATTSNAFNKKMSVATQVVKMSDIGGGQVFPGQITPETLTNVASKLSGKVTAMQVHVGDYVKVGQSLAIIDTSQLQQQLQQSQGTVGVNQAQVNQALENQANNIANAKISVESSQANLTKVQSDYANSVAAAQQAVAVAKAQLQKAQSDQENSIAQAQQALAVSQAQLDQAKASHAASLATASAQLNSAQAGSDNSNQSTDNSIQVLQQQVDQARTAYHDALQGFTAGANSPSSYIQYQTNIDTSNANLLAKELQLQQAQAQSSLNNALVQASLQSAQTAMQNAQNDKSVQVAMANYNQSVEKLTELQNDQNSLDVTQKQFDQSAQSLQNAQNSTAGIGVAKAQLDQSNQAVNSAQSTAGIAVTQAQLQAAETNVQVINEQLQDGILKAPVTGIVTAINSPVGQMAAGANGVVSIASTDPTIATVNVPEASIGKIKIGTPMFVKIPTLNNTVEGKVLHIHPTLDPVTKSYGVDIQVDDPNHQLLPGMFAEATLKSEGKQAIMVPSDAVLSEANGNSVFIDVNGKAKKVLVKIGEMTSAQYQITSGLKVGDQLVVKGEELLSDGMPIQDVSQGKQSGNQSQSSSAAAKTKATNNKQAAAPSAASSDTSSAAGGKQ